MSNLRELDEMSDDMVGHAALAALLVASIVLAMIIVVGVAGATVVAALSVPTMVLAR